jgi:glutamyl/glutaminyl-tRNA synthetase
VAKATGGQFLLRVEDTDQVTWFPLSQTNRL